MKYLIKPLDYSYSWKLCKFFERSIEKSMTEDLEIMIEHSEVKVKPNLMEYFSLADLEGNCRPLFAKETPEFLLEFLQRTYVTCHNYMVENLENLDNL